MTLTVRTLLFALLLLISSCAVTKPKVNTAEYPLIVERVIFKDSLVISPPITVEKQVYDTLTRVVSDTVRIFDDKHLVEARYWTDEYKRLSIRCSRLPDTVRVTVTKSVIKPVEIRAYFDWMFYAAMFAAFVFGVLLTRFVLK